MNTKCDVAVWFPTVRTGTGTDVFTERLVAGLAERNIRAEITWLPPRAEYAPWTVPTPSPPSWSRVAHVNTWLHPRFLPKNLPVLATLHHSMHDPTLRPYKGMARAMYHRWWIAPSERRVLRQADRVVAVSRCVAETTRQTLLDVPADVIYNGVDTARFRPGNHLRRSGEPFRLLYVGGWKRLKGVHLLAPLMRKLGRGFELRYTGGPAAERDRATMPPSMHDLGRLSADGVVAAMQDADAFLFPSYSEGFGLVAVEAMACSLPVIATRGSSLIEIVDDGTSGILCDAGDVEGFARAVQRLALDPGLHKRMSRSAFERANRMFATDSMVDAYIKRYCEITLLAGTKRRSDIAGICW